MSSAEGCCCQMLPSTPPQQRLFFQSLVAKRHKCSAASIHLLLRHFEEQFSKRLSLFFPDAHKHLNSDPPVRHVWPVLPASESRPERSSAQEDEHRGVYELQAMPPPFELQRDFSGLLELSSVGKTHCKISLADDSGSFRNRRVPHRQRFERQSIRNILKERLAALLPSPAEALAFQTSADPRSLGPFSVINVWVPQMGEW